MFFQDKTATGDAILSCDDEKLIRKLILATNAFALLEKNSFVYSTMLGATRLTEIISLLFEKQDAHLQSYKVFFLFLLSGQKIIDLSILLEELSEAFHFWTFALKSPARVAYYFVACKYFMIILKVGPIYYIQKKALWFLTTKNSFRSEIYQQRMEIFSQISMLLSHPWLLALEGDEGAMSKILLKVSHAQLSATSYMISSIALAKPNLVWRIWPIAITATICFLTMGQWIANANFEWLLDRLLQCKEMVISVFVKWILSPLQDMWTTIRYKTRRFGIESSLSSDADASKLCTFNP